MQKKKKTIEVVNEKFKDINDLKERLEIFRDRNDHASERLKTHTQY